jgi:hypothetical protein
LLRWNIYKSEIVPVHSGAVHVIPYTRKMENCDEIVYEYENENDYAFFTSWRVSVPANRMRCEAAHDDIRPPALITARLAPA